MKNPKPAPFNVVSNDTLGTIWALPEGAIARLGKGFQRYQGDNDIVLSPDGTYFAAGTRSGLWWYDVPSMSPIALWETERGTIEAVDISPNGKFVAFDNWDGIIKVRDIHSGEFISGEFITQIKRVVYKHITFSPNSKWIAIVTIANEKKVIEVLDIRRGMCIAQMDWGEQELNSSITQLDFSPDGEFLAATTDKQTYLWNSNTGEIVDTFEGRNFAFSPDSRLFAFQNPYIVPNSEPLRGASTVLVWNLVTGERIAHFTEPTHLVSTLIFSPCGQFLASCERNRTLRVWNLTKGVLKETYKDYGMPYYLPDGTLFSTVFTGKTIEVWDVVEHEKLWTYERKNESIGDKWFSKCPKLPIVHFLSNYPKKTDKKYSFPTLDESLCYSYPGHFSPNGDMFASIGHTKGIVLWNVKSKQMRKTVIKGQSIKSFAFLPCGNILAIDRNREDFTVWEVSDADEVTIGKFTVSHDLGRGTYSVSNYQIALAGKGGIIYLWDINHSEKPRSFIGHTDHIWGLTFSPDGKRLVSGSSDKTARLWDVEIGEEIATLPLAQSLTTRALAFSPCGSVIAGGMFGELNMWCAEKLTLLHTISQPEDSPRPYALAFSPCGQYLASGTWWHKGMEQMAIRLWDVATGENIRTFWGHTTDVQSLAFSPDGTLLASGGFDGTCLLWNVDTFI